MNVTFARLAETFGVTSPLLTYVLPWTNRVVPDGPEVPTPVNPAGPHTLVTFMTWVFTRVAKTFGVVSALLAATFPSTYRVVPEAAVVPTPIKPVGPHTLVTFMTWVFATRAYTHESGFVTLAIPTVGNPARTFPKNVEVTPWTVRFC